MYRCNTIQYNTKLKMQYNGASFRLHAKSTSLARQSSSASALSRPTLCSCSGMAMSFQLTYESFEAGCSRTSSPSFSWFHSLFYISTTRNGSSSSCGRPVCTVVFRSTPIIPQHSNHPHHTSKWNYSFWTHWAQQRRWVFYYKRRNMNEFSNE